jgi:hypothetical protein
LIQDNYAFIILGAWRFSLRFWRIFLAQLIRSDCVSLFVSPLTLSSIYPKAAGSKPSMILLPEAPPSALLPPPTTTRAHTSTRDCCTASAKRFHHLLGHLELRPP